MARWREVLRGHWPIYAGSALYLILDLRCPVLSLLGVPCPTCGVTRALLALARRDWAGYVAHNFMAVFLVSAVLLYLHRDCFRRQAATAITAYTMAVLAVNTVRYGSLLASLL